MKMMDSVIIFSVAVVLLLMINSASPERLEKMCCKVSCNSSTPICRLTQNCAGPYCPLQATCLTCLPKGIESVCTGHGYVYAVIVEDKDAPSGIIERKCLLRQPNNEPNCPSGTFCVPDGRGFGTCCYGEARHLPRSEVVSKKLLKTCPRVVNMCGHCKRDRNVCKEFPIYCLIPPCPEPIYKCVPIERKGKCPSPSEVCERRFHRCFHDYECSGSFKCCPDVCRIRSCVAPVLDCVD